MPKMWENLTPAQQLTLAVHHSPPHRLALTFAAYVGQFYDRSAFDALARRASDLYAGRDEASAYRFRERLDLRLHDRYHDPVAWDVDPPGSELGR